MGRMTVAAPEVGSRVGRGTELFKLGPVPLNLLTKRTKQDIERAVSSWLRNDSHVNNFLQN